MPRRPQSHSLKVKLAQETHQARRVKSAGDAALLVQNQRRQDIVLVGAAAVVGAALDLAVVEHTVGQIVDITVGQELEGRRVIDVYFRYRR